MQDFATGLLLVGVAELALAIPVSYTLHEIINPDGRKLSASDINDYGVATGSYTTSNGEIHVHVWDSMNGMTDIEDHKSRYSHGYSINNTGQVTDENSAESGSYAFV